MVSISSVGVPQKGNRYVVSSDSVESLSVP
jgi:hypothetical protein